MTALSKDTSLHPTRLAPGNAASDRTCVERVRTGDVEAFEAMFRFYKNDLGAFVRSYV